jgi:WD40 repeat protein
MKISRTTKFHGVRLEPETSAPRRDRTFLRQLVSGGSSQPARGTVAGSTLLDLFQRPTGDVRYELMQTLHVGDYVRRMALGSNGTVVTDSLKIELWNPTTGDCIQSLKKPGELCSLAMTADGNILTVTEGATFANGPKGGQAQLWDAKTGKLIRTLEPEGVRRIDVAADGTILTFGEPGNLYSCKLWAPDGSRCLHRFRDGNPTDGVFASDGAVLLNDWQRLMRWDPATGQSTRIIKGDHWGFTSIAAGTNGIIATASHGGAVKVWNAESGQCVHTLLERSQYGGDRPSTVAVLSGGNIVTSTPNQPNRIWSSKTGQCVQKLPGESFLHIAAAADGIFVTTSGNEKFAKVWAPVPTDDEE